MTPFSAGLFETLEVQLGEARDFALDAPSITDQSYSHEHFVCCLALIRQAQLTVSELKDHVAKLEGENPNDSAFRRTVRQNSDDEPSAGDVVEEPDIRGMVSALATKARPR